VYKTLTQRKGKHFKMIDVFQKIELLRLVKILQISLLKSSIGSLQNHANRDFLRVSDAYPSSTMDIYHFEMFLYFKYIMTLPKATFEGI